MLRLPLSQDGVVTGKIGLAVAHQVDWADIGPVSKMQIAWPATAGAYGKATGQMGLRAGREVVAVDAETFFAETDTPKLVAFISAGVRKMPH